MGTEDNSGFFFPKLGMGFGRRKISSNVFTAMGLHNLSLVAVTSQRQLHCKQGGFMLAGRATEYFREKQQRN